MALNLFAVPAGAPFLDELAAGWLSRAGGRGGSPSGNDLATSGGLILLPTRRAARALADAFLRANAGAPMLLPRITALGALDEAPLALSGALDLPPAVEPMQRLAALARLILAMGGEGGAPRTADGAWVLAGELAALMDEAERAGIDLADRLPDAADPEFAAHWAQTLQFLHIVTAHWPGWLAQNGAMNPAARQVALLNAQAAAWEAASPVETVTIAGTTAGIPAVARLLRTVARLPQGRVVLPQLDLSMPDDAWAALEPSHAQYGLARLLADLGCRRGDVRPWQAGAAAPVPGHRFALLSRALLPAPALADWTDRAPVPIDGLMRLEPADQQQEAAAIALVLRDAIEAPGAVAALVTPDRALAGRVAAELLRFGIVADDSAGEPLADTPPAVLLRLLARAVTERLAPVPLLALLKHPLAALGLSPAACRESARALEAACLRGPRPRPGLAGLRLAAVRHPVAAAFVDRIEASIEPALRIAAGLSVAPLEALDALIGAAERLAATDEAEGPARLWAHEEGEALAAALSALRDALPVLPDIAPADLPGLLDAALQGQAVRTRRALRGRGGAEHPRVHIWGLLEARLQSADAIVLGGLAEGSWPPAADTGPWLSRPMRRKAGLPQPEEAVGQAAHDFLSACCAAPRAVLSCPARRDGAPAVPARWLVRLDMFLQGRGQSLPHHPAAAWAAAMDQPDPGPLPVRPPRPAPPVRLRPRSLSVTEIETWLRDPYAIYAKHVLDLRVLRPLEEPTDAADYGKLVHEGMRRFLAEHGAAWPDGAREELRRAMARALAEAGLREALQAWWAPRLDRIADWVAAQESERRAARAPVAIAAEAGGRLDLSRPGGAFRLTGRADRIERYADGSLAILDYKTGQPPSQRAVEAGLAPQLLLEAAMAERGAFGQELAGETNELVYWQLTGGIVPGKPKPLYKDHPNAIPIAAGQALDSLAALIDDFDRQDRPYLSRPRPGQAPRFADYAQLARVAEWSLAGDDAPEGEDDE